MYINTHTCPDVKLPKMVMLVPKRTAKTKSLVIKFHPVRYICQSSFALKVTVQNRKIIQNFERLSILFEKAKKLVQQRKKVQLKAKPFIFTVFVQLQCSLRQVERHKLLYSTGKPPYIAPCSSCHYHVFPPPNVANTVASTGSSGVQ